MSCLLILNIDHTLRVRIAEVALVREPEVDVVLREGVLDLVGVDAGR